MNPYAKPGQCPFCADHKKMIVRFAATGDEREEVCPVCCPTPKSCAWCTKAYVGRSLFCSDRCYLASEAEMHGEKK